MHTWKIEIILAHLHPLIRAPSDQSLSFQPKETDPLLAIECPSKTLVRVVNGRTCQLVPLAGNQLNWYSCRVTQKYIPLSCWTSIYPFFENSVDPDQLASDKAIYLIRIHCVFHSDWKYKLTTGMLQVNRIKIRGGGECSVSYLAYLTSDGRRKLQNP